jgi:hypothetical protein
VIRFTIPLAVAKAVTTRSRLTPAKSATGARMGIDRTARPEVEGTKKDIPTSIQ